MSRIHLAALLTLPALAFTASTVVAQVVFAGLQGTVDRSNQGRALEDKDVYTCQGAPGGWRVRASCEVEQCGAITTMLYEQRDSVARGSGTLTIADCTLASGPIGDNVELVSARLRGLTCICADAVPETEAPPPADE
jgi:hypothetical protein